MRFVALPLANRSGDSDPAYVHVVAEHVVAVTALGACSYVQAGAHGHYIALPGEAVIKALIEAGARKGGE